MCKNSKAKKPKKEDRGAMKYAMTTKCLQIGLVLHGDSICIPFISYKVKVVGNVKQEILYDYTSYPASETRESYIESRAGKDDLAANEVC
mmetsp:Transcript_31680/g.39046  ORF Transcript_31680/g.39046 Transcript_31680/m.39046 type:complete len:90 (+) Transcript_31680:501-770(+)